MLLAALTDRVTRSRRAAILTVIAWLLAASLIPLLAPSLKSVEENANADSPPAAAASVAARDLLRTAFPDQQGTPAIVVLHDPGGLADADLAEVRRIADALTGPDKPPSVLGVVSIATAPAARSSLLSPDGTTTTMLVPIGGSPADDAFRQTVARVRELAGTGSGNLEIRVTGPAGIIADTYKVFAGANVVLLLVTVALMLAILLAIYRSPFLALLPLIAVGIAIEVTNGVGALLVQAGLFGVNAQAASIMTVLLFGVGTDYCLFIVARQREELTREPDARAALRRTMRRVAQTLASSAATVILALLTLLLATLPALRGFGPFLALSVVVMLAAGLTLVPALLALLGRRAFWPARPVVGPERETGRSPWQWVADRIARRPGVAIAGSLALLAVLTLGLTSYHESYNFIRGFRVATDSKRGQELLMAAFPAGSLAPTMVLLDAGGARIAQQLDTVERVTQAIAAIPGVANVSGPTRPGGQPGGDPVALADGPGRQYRSPDDRVARLSVVYSDDPYAAPALDRTARVRAVAREAMRTTVPQGGRALVGGESAQNLDIRTALARDTRVIVPVILLLIGAVLALLLRSLVAPVYLIATIVASFFATLGLSTFVLLDLLGNDGIGNRVTIYIFVFLVALGVDYNIFIMGRVREETREHGLAAGTRRALTRTGGVITSAGLILAGTFAVLISQPIRELYQFGFAMAIGLLLDTFLVRGVLVPAIVLTLGRWNWWPSTPNRARTDGEAARTSDRPAVPALD